MTPALWRWPDRGRIKAYAEVVLKVGIVFVIFYGGANYLANRSQNLFRFYFEWEQFIPFYPAFILAYLSLSALTLCPLFLMSEAATRELGRQMILATVLAATVFLIFPATTLWLRESDMALVWRPLFEMIYLADHPFNTFPSLHVTYAGQTVLALWPTLGGGKRMFLSIWLALICASVLLVRQHHVLDVVGGLGLAVLLKWKLKTKTV